MDPCPGSITVEYYDGSSEFSDSEGSNCPNLREHSRLSSPCSSTSTPSITESVSCKTYDFKHVSSENEFDDQEFGGRGCDRQRIFSDIARKAMNSHFVITHQERIESLVHTTASFSRCPRGDLPEQYGRRKHPGPFLTCSFSYSHECGDDFVQIQMPTKPTSEFQSFTRPQHLKEKKAKFFKPCKHCETIAFTHHRNPARHYEDYLNNVTYKQHSNHTKVWQQHLVDFMFMMGEKNSYSICADADVVDKCKHYKPSEAIVKATKYQRNPQRRIPTVITTKRSAIVRPLKRPLIKTNVSKISNFTNTTRTRVNLPEQKQISEANPYQLKREAKNPSFRTLDMATRNARSLMKPKDEILQSIRRSSSCSSIDGCKPSALHEKIKASAARIIHSRQASSKVSKRFVKKAEPFKEVKYVQRGKPNISARLLRARSKNKVFKSSTWNSHLISPSLSRSKRRSSISSKKQRSTQTKLRRASGQSHTTTEIMLHTKGHSKDDSSEDGSYAQYRDQNGEFDGEKYRRSILKMLFKSTGNETAEKKRKLKRSPHSKLTNFVALPKIRNVYRNAKPRVTTNVTLRKKKMNARKLMNHTNEFDIEVSSYDSFKPR